VPLSWGALQQVLDRVTQASAPHDEALAPHARQAPGNSMDEPAWFRTHPRPWRWVRAHDRVAFSLMHPHRATEALAALIDDWEGLLGSAGSGGSHSGVPARHTCLAPRIRTARGVAARRQPDRAAGGAWAMAAWQRLGHRAQAPPTGGEGPYKGRLFENQVI
jgi:transposase